MFAALVSLAAAVSQAETVTFNLDHEFSAIGDPGSTALPPAGRPPWLTATFEDVGVNSVRLTMQAANLTGAEHVKVWCFNFAQDAAVDSLNFAHDSGVAASRVQTEQDGFKADGDGYYDITFKFPNRSNARFGESDTSVYSITGTGITAESFHQLSTLAADSRKGPFTTAAHVGGISLDYDTSMDGGSYGPLESGVDCCFPASTGSGWVAPSHAPEPSTFVGLLSMGIIGLVAYTRRRRKQAA